MIGYVQAIMQYDHQVIVLLSLRGPAQDPITTPLAVVRREAHLLLIRILVVQVVPVVHPVRGAASRPVLPASKDLLQVAALVRRVLEDIIRIDAALASQGRLQACTLAPLWNAAVAIHVLVRALLIR